MSGRSVRLFLIDGTPQGIRTAEVGNWTGLALVCPRTDLVRLRARDEVRRTGVYILVGPSESSASGLAVYVGEGDDVWDRLSSHDERKDFWTWVAIFVSKDENLTKAHVRWLESRIVADILKAKRAESTNANAPGGNKLPEPDTADMETYYENVRLLLPTLGLNIFEAEAVATPHGSAAVPTLMLELRWEDALATCLVVDGQFVVQALSTARVREVESLGESSRATRNSLRKQGVLVPFGNLLRFTQDYAFDSPSAAAAVVSGTGLNGRTAWKVKETDLTYKEWRSYSHVHSLDTCPSRSHSSAHGSGVGKSRSFPRASRVRSGASVLVSRMRVASTKARTPRSRTSRVDRATSRSLCA